MSLPPSTRTRILHAAAEHFMAKGYQRTSLQAIATQLGLTKATILYHFPAKEDLAAELIEPVVADLEAAVSLAAEQPPDRRAWMMIEGWLDTVLVHRQMLRTLIHDLALLSRNSQNQRLLNVNARAVEIIGGPHAGQRDVVRAVQAIAMVSDPVVFSADADPSSLRADMLDGVRRLLGPDTHTPTSASPHGRSRSRRGRPAALSAEQVRAARAMHEDGSQPIEDIAAGFGVSRATLYRHLRQPYL